MVQFEILSGKTAGQRWLARRFPVRIGRSANCDLQLEESGVWEHHCEITFDPGDGFVITRQSDALLSVNHEPVASARLRNGDSVELAGARLRFWLGDPAVETFRAEEALVWTLVAGVGLGQLLLAWWLMR